jgi:hypothetical protein
MLFGIEQGSTNGLMLNNAILVLFDIRLKSSSIWHKKNELSVRLYYWLYKKIETLQLFFATSIFEIHTSYVEFLSSLTMPCSGSYLEFTISNKTYFAKKHSRIVHNISIGFCFCINRAFRLHQSNYNPVNMAFVTILKFDSTAKLVSDEVYKRTILLVYFKLALQFQRGNLNIP